MKFLNIGKKGAFLTLIVFSLTLSLLCTPTFVSAAAEQKPAASEESAAPNFQLPDLNGTTVDFAKIKGQKPVLLYFWASWCSYCMAVRPAVVDLRNAVPQNDLEILAINVGVNESLEKVKRYQQAHPAPFTVLYDADSKVVHQYQVQGIPLFVLLDKSGAVKYRGNELPPNLMNLVKR
jgi:peroxiredoxin